jgi:tetratricopeptide (TPR) repeat protein
MTQSKPQRNNYANPAQAQQYFIMQNRAIEQYSKLGNQYELKKQWENAERTFAYVLQIINMRDGVDSQKSIAPLKHLVTASDAQHKVKQAIYYQTNVLKVTKAAKVPARAAVVQESLSLSNLLIKDKDYPKAESVLRQSIALAKQEPVMTKERTTTLVVLGKVYKAQNKTQEAAEVESELAQNLPKSPEIETAPSSSTSSGSQSLVPSTSAASDTALQPTIDNAATSNTTTTTPAADSNSANSTAPQLQPPSEASAPNNATPQPAVEAANSSSPSPQPPIETPNAAPAPQPAIEAPNSSNPALQTPP